MWAYVTAMVVTTMLATYWIFSPRIRDTLVQRLILTAISILGCAEAYSGLFAGRPAGWYPVILVLAGVVAITAFATHTRRTDGEL